MKALGGSVMFSLAGWKIMKEEGDAGVPLISIWEGKMNTFTLSSVCLWKVKPSLVSKPASVFFTESAGELVFEFGVFCAHSYCHS